MRRLVLVLVSIAGIVGAAADEAEEGLRHQQWEAEGKQHLADVDVDGVVVDDVLLQEAAEVGLGHRRGHRVHKVRLLSAQKPLLPDVVGAGVVVEVDAPPAAVVVDAADDSSPLHLALDEQGEEVVVIVVVVVVVAVVAAAAADAEGEDNEGDKEYEKREEGLLPLLPHYILPSSGLTYSHTLLLHDVVESTLDVLLHRKEMVHFVVEEEVGPCCLGNHQGEEALDGQPQEEEVVAVHLFDHQQTEDATQSRHAHDQLIGLNQALDKKNVFPLCPYLYPYLCLYLYPDPSLESVIGAVLVQVLVLAVLLAH